jgi:hypothetical protein
MRCSSKLSLVLTPSKAQFTGFSILLKKKVKKQTKIIIKRYAKVLREKK